MTTFSFARLGFAAVFALGLGAGTAFAEDVPQAELDAMRDLVQEGMDAGAVGLSTGLIYAPGRAALRPSRSHASATWLSRQPVVARGLSHFRRTARFA